MTVPADQSIVIVGAVAQPVSVLKAPAVTDNLPLLSSVIRLFSSVLTIPLIRFCNVILAPSP